jgi:hypothetical protein
MSTIRVGNNIPIRWSEFSADPTPTVRAYWKRGEEAAVFIESIDNSYATAVDANADGLNRHSANVIATEAMIGADVVILIRDSEFDDIEEEATEEPHVICTDIATSIVVTPPSSSVSIGKTRQFTENIYAADGLPTTNHDAVVWTTTASGATQGSINVNTGLFTAGSAIGGPYTVTATAGAIHDDASITVRETSSAALHSSGMSASLSITI